MSEDRPEIRQWLAERGYPPAVIDKILLRLDDFDARIKRESVFDAIQTGEIDIDSIIKDALGDQGAK